MKLRVVLTGATGMVGEGVLLECLGHPDVHEVLMVNRKAYGGQQHRKLRELIVSDFLELDGFTKQLSGFDACFYCAGVSSRGMSEEGYRHVTYDITLHFAQAFQQANPQAVFVYVSGEMTDSSEKGRIMWARVKGATENALMRLGFRGVYNFRLGLTRPTIEQKNIKWYYRLIGLIYPTARIIVPHHVATMREVGVAMINSVTKGYPKQVLEMSDIKALAKA